MPAKKSKKKIDKKKKEYRYNKDSLKNRTKEDVKTKDEGSFGKKVFDYSDYDEVNFFKPEIKHKYKIDIIPYIVTSDNHPKVEEGDIDYVLDIHVHSFVGAAEDSFICLKKTYGKPCPICEEIEIMKQEDADDKVIEALKPRRRCVYNIIDLNEPDKGIQIFSVSYYLFQKELLEEAEATGDDEGIITFSDLEEGMSINFRASEGNYKGRKYVEYKKFDFEEREEPYPDEVLDEVYPLDALLTIADYEEIKSSFLGIDDDDDEEDEEEVEEKEERKSKKKSKSKDKKKKAANKCPHGHKFGEDCDETDDCEECEIWEDCQAKYEELEDE